MIFGRADMEQISYSSMVDSLCKSDSLLQVCEVLISDKFPFGTDDICEMNFFMRKMKLHSEDRDFIAYMGRTYSEKQLLTLGDALLKIESLVEGGIANDYLRGKKDTLDEKIGRCSPCMTMEGKSLGVTSDSHVLVVGSGSMPLTGIVFSRAFGSTVTCLDIDYKAIACSKALVEGLGIGAKFNYLCKDIFDYTCFSEYTHLLITGHIRNKNTLLKKIHSLIEGQMVLVRNPVGFYRKVYGSADDFVGYNIVSLLEHWGAMPYRSTILKKLLEPEKSSYLGGICFGSKCNTVL
jgi:hypothetical protein